MWAASIARVGVGTVGEADDRELLQRWGAGDAAAGNALVERHFAPIFRFLRRRVSEAAEDLTQRTFEAALGQRDRLKEDGSFRAYLFGIARNQALMHLREYNRRLVRPLWNDDDPGPPGLTPTGQVQAKQERKVLLRAMKTLPLDLQIALELSLWEEMSNAEIAAVLGIPKSTVSSRTFRARELLREALRTMDISEALRQSTLGSFESWAASLQEHRDGGAG